MEKDTSILYGKDQQKNIVGIIPSGTDSVDYYVRRDDGTVRMYNEKCWTIFLTTEKGVEEAKQHHQPEWKKGNHKVVVLKDHEHGHYNRAILSHDSKFNYKLRKAIGEKGISYRTIGSRTAQWLIQTGKTMMKGMTIQKLRRMQIDIETISPSGGFSLAERESDQIVIIAISDNHGYRKVLHIGDETTWNDETYMRCENEREMLIELIRQIDIRDPDVIEGHNFYGFDMPYIMKRFDLYDMEFVVGRDKNKPTVRRDAEAKFAEQVIVYDEYKIGGRTIVDTMFLVKAFDVYKRALPSHGLKDSAKYFKIAREGRVYIEGDEITRTWQEDPNTLLEYALDDVLETMGLSDKLLPATFALAQMVPNTFQRIHLGGVGNAIELMFIREYLRNRTAIPVPENESQQHGGLVGVCKTGRIPNLLYIDVASLYPTIMLEYDVKPESDVLNLFQRLLRMLTDLRLEKKAAMNAEEEGSEMWVMLDAMQAAYKVNINSFYGYLGFTNGAWNDISEADRVAITGQVILWRMIEVTTKLGCELVECDTDGILTIAPDGFDMKNALKFVKEEVEPLMPKGIVLDLDGTFKWMLSYKAKNYALLNFDDEVKFKGGAWKNRGIEKYARDFMKRTLGNLLRGKWKELRADHLAVRRQILNKQLPLKEFQVKKNLKMELSDYLDRKKRGKTNISAQYEIWSRQPDRWMVGDVVHFWVSKHTRRQKAVKIAADARHVDLYKKGMENSEHLNTRFKQITSKFATFFDKKSFGILFDQSMDIAEQNMFGEVELDESTIVCPIKDTKDVMSLKKEMERNQAYYWNTHK